MKPEKTIDFSNAMFYYYFDSISVHLNEILTNRTYENISNIAWNFMGMKIVWVSIRN